MHASYRNHHLLQIPSDKIDMVLDTDTYNEIDDQFAVAYALLADDVLDCHAIYAAPFNNRRSNGPADGMEKSYEEIERVLLTLGRKPIDSIFRGSTRFMKNAEDSVESAARDDLIERAMQRSPEDDPLYVVAIGAPTNVASAIVKEPAIADRIVVVWLGGHASWFDHQDEFNCVQDYHASALLFDGVAPMHRIPCIGCADYLMTTHGEMRDLCKMIDHPMSAYFLKIYEEFVPERPGHSKVIWDISAIAWLIDRTWFNAQTVPSPILHKDMSISQSVSRSLTIEALRVDRDKVFKDLFNRIEILASSVFA